MHEVQDHQLASPVRIGFLLIEGFSAMAFISAVEGLRSANRLLNTNAYEWLIMSHNREPVTASNGIPTPVDIDFSEPVDLDYLFVVASLDYDPPYRARLHAYLNRLERTETKLGALSLGTWILARAGLLKRAKCTIHWEALPAFREAFPDISATNELFVIDNGRYTASGGIAGMEIMLEIIRQEHGEDLVQAIANVFQLDRIRTSNMRQRSGKTKRLDTLPASIKESIAIMQDNLETPLSIAEIATSMNTSVRNLERGFRRRLQISPARYYQSLRLEKARELLMYTNLSTLEIALQCGFSSSSYFARCFQREFGIRPSQQRQRG